MSSLFPTTPHVHISSYPPLPYLPAHQSSVLHKSLSYLLLHALYLSYSQHWLLFWFYSIAFPVEALEARPWPERKILKSGHSNPASKVGVTHLGLDAAPMISSADVHSKFLFAISTYVSQSNTTYSSPPPFTFTLSDDLFLFVSLLYSSSSNHDSSVIKLEFPYPFSFHPRIFSSHALQLYSTTCTSKIIFLLRSHCLYIPLLTPIRPLLHIIFLVHRRRRLPS